MVHSLQNTPSGELISAALPKSSFFFLLVKKHPFSLSSAANTAREEKSQASEVPNTVFLSCQTKTKEIFSGRENK
jgi:hypothetical protein